MDCQECGGLTRVIELKTRGAEVRRYRVCSKCGHKFVTIERPLSFALKD